MNVRERPTVSVVIPTYERPEYLKSSFNSLLCQKVRPDQIIIVVRDTDKESNAVANTLAEECEAGLVTVRQVSNPGFVPPIIEGARSAYGDIVAYLDDDAIADKEWLQRILRHYEHPDVGGVGGRCIEIKDGKEEKRKPAKYYGIITWYGKLIGNMHRPPRRHGCFDVMFLMGGNMSYRRSLLLACLPDSRLNQNVAFHWEVDVGLNVRKLRSRIIYDTEICIDHFSAPRKITGLRELNFQGVYFSNLNIAMIMRKHFPPHRVFIFMFYSTLIGNSSTRGLLRTAFDLMRGMPNCMSLLAAATSGRWRGVFERPPMSE